MSRIKTDALYQSHSGKGGQRSVRIWKHIDGEGKIKSFEPDCLQPSTLIYTESVHAIVTLYFSCMVKQ